MEKEVARGERAPPGTERSEAHAAARPGRPFFLRRWPAFRATGLGAVVLLLGAARTRVGLFVDTRVPAGVGVGISITASAVTAIKITATAVAIAGINPSSSVVTVTAAVNTAKTGTPTGTTASPFSPGQGCAAPPRETAKGTLTGTGASSRGPCGMTWPLTLLLSPCQRHHLLPNQEQAYQITVCFHFGATSDAALGERGFCVGGRRGRRARSSCMAERERDRDMRRLSLAFMRHIARFYSFLCLQQALPGRAA